MRTSSKSINIRLNAVLVLVILVAWPSSSFAAGLVAEVTGNPLQQLELMQLTELQLDVEIVDNQASYTEIRWYSGPQEPGFGFNGFDVVQKDYTFYRSLPENLAETTISQVLINGLEVDSQILQGKDAQKKRRELVGQLNDPAPLREAGTPLLVVGPVSLNISPFMPADIQLTLTQPLSPRGTLGAVSIPVDWHRAPVNYLNLNLSAESQDKLRAIYSPFDKLEVEREDAYKATANAISYQRCTAFDVELLVSTGNDPFHLDLLPYRYDDVDGGFFMALISSDPEPDEAAVVPRDIVVVLDQSGSMQGEKIAQAKTALHQVLDGLRAEDSFSLVRFNGGVAEFSSTTLLATPDNIADAKNFVDTTHAEGGTNIYDALSTAFQSLPNQNEHPRYVLFLTDGQATEGETDTDVILNMAKLHNEMNARIFTFGIGYNVNTYLLDQLAMDSSGDAIYIQPGQNVATAVETFFAQISDPVLTDPTLNLDAIGAIQLYPSELSDLFAGQTATILGRYNKGTTGIITLSGKANGSDQVHAFEITLPEYSVKEGYVPRVWATRHVGSLLQEVKLGNSDPEIVEEVMQIAERFGVVTEFTYFEVDEDGNTQMKYSPVPVDAVGGVAVATSSSLDGYQKGGTVGASVDTYVRYTWDRTLPIVESWFTDTSLDLDSDWIYVEFGSDEFFELASNATDLGIGDFLAIDRNIRFEFLGQAYQVTDPTNANNPGKGCGVKFPSGPSEEDEVSVTPIDEEKEEEEEEEEEGDPEELREPCNTDKKQASQPEKADEGQESAECAKVNDEIDEEIDEEIDAELDVRQRFAPEDEASDNSSTMQFQADEDPSYGCSLGGHGRLPKHASGLMLLLLALGAHTLTQRRRSVARL